MPNHVLQVDRRVRSSLNAFVADATAQQWQGTERGCVSRVAMDYLVGACGPHHCLKHPSQISPPDLVATLRLEEVRVHGGGHEPLTLIADTAN